MLPADHTNLDYKNNRTLTGRGCMGIMIKMALYTSKWTKWKKKKKYKRE